MRPSKVVRVKNINESVESIIDTHLRWNDFPYKKNLKALRLKDIDDLFFTTSMNGLETEEIDKFVKSFLEKVNGEYVAVRVVQLSVDSIDDVEKMFKSIGEENIWSTASLYYRSLDGGSYRFLVESYLMDDNERNAVWEYRIISDFSFYYKNGNFLRNMEECLNVEVNVENVFLPSDLTRRWVYKDECSFYIGEIIEQFKLEYTYDEVYEVVTKLAQKKTIERLSSLS